MVPFYFIFFYFIVLQRFMLHVLSKFKTKTIAIVYLQICDRGFIPELKDILGSPHLRIRGDCEFAC